jgi:hypothetical protein
MGTHPATVALIVKSDYECMSFLGAFMTLRSVLAVAALLLGAACSSSPAIRDCVSDADCGDGNVCHQGGCAANAPPVATLPAPPAPTTHRLVALVPSTSDPEGRSVTHRWTVLATVGGCEPDLEPAAGGALSAIFWCPGTYEATVVPVDHLGLEGAPAVSSFDVSAATGAPTVEAGPAVLATHRCAGTPLGCEVLGPDGTPDFSLGASRTDLDDAPLTWEWRALPPPGVGEDAPLSVTFAPGANAPQVTTSISIAGGAIAGLYRFRVRAQNPEGLIAQAVQEVVVANSAPTLGVSTLSMGHRFRDGQFVAEGALETGALDLDGDALIVSGAITPAPTAGCTEEVARGTGTSVDVLIACPVASALIGATVRTLTLTVVDGNGATAAASAPLAITNEPPSIVLAPAFGGFFTVDHRVEPCALAPGATCFVADGADPYVVSDPDGDPLSEYSLGASVAAGRTASRGTVMLNGEAYRFRFETPTTLPLQFRSTSGASGFTVSVAVRDPWGATSASRPLTVLNRPPFVKEVSPTVQVPHAYDAAARSYVASANGARFEDPDGDPLEASLPPYNCCNTVSLVAGRAVVGCALAWDYALGGVPPLRDFATLHPVTIGASDGWGSVSAPTAITILDRPATVTVPVATVESCSLTGVPLPVQLSDPDGDPSTVSAHVPGTTDAAPATCLPGWCYPTLNAANPGTIQGEVWAFQGESYGGVQAPFAVTRTCSAALTWE